MSRKALWIVVLLVVASGAVALVVLRRRSAAPVEPRFTTVAIDRGKIAARVTASGTLSALVTVQVGSQVSGRILQIAADFNTRVKRGQLIARIDPQLFEAAVEQARANLLAAEGNATKARVQAEEAERQAQRTRSLHQQQLVAQAELDTAETNVAAANAQAAASRGAVQQMRAALHQAEINLAYTYIHSPIDGVVISRNVDVGQTVAASLQAPTLFTIAEDLRKMQVDTNVAEADVGKLRAGMDAYFSVDAYPGERFRGTVRQIRNAPQTIQNVVTYDAVIDVANPDLKLKPGMTANVTFPYADRDNVLRISNAALRFRPTADLLGTDGGALSRRPPRGEAPAPGRTVWVLRQGRPVGVTIQTGITDGSQTEVLEDGLKEGDLVITDSADSGRGSSVPPAFRRVL